MNLENVQDIYPLSPLQAGMLFHAIEASEPGLYVLQIRVTLDGALDQSALRAAWDEVVQRHEALRAAFVWEGLDEPLQVIRETVRTPWARLDARDLIARSGPDAVDRWLLDDRRRGFTLNEAPLMRVALIGQEGGTHRLVWTLHHLLADAWSVAVVLRELAATYRAHKGGPDPGLPAAPPFRDHIAWLQERDFDAARPLWQAYLAGFQAPLEVRLAPPESPGAETESGRVVHELELAPPATEALAAVARRRRITATALYHVAWALVLSRYAGTDDVVFGSVVSGRGHGLPGAEHAVGMYMNTIPVRVRADAARTLGELVDTVHRDSLALRAHEHTPLGLVRGWSEVPAGVPLFDTLLIVENHPPVTDEGQGLVFRDVDPMDQSNYPLAAFIIPDQGLRLLLMVDPAEVDGAAARRLLAQFAHALGTLPSSLDRPPRALPVLPAEEAERLERLARGPALPAVEETSILQLIAKHVRERPEAIALACEDHKLTYGALASQMMALAQDLTAGGVGPGDRVAILLERGTEPVVAMLGILAAGAAYVPLDPAYPSARIRQMLAICEPARVVSTRELAAAHGVDPERLVLLDVQTEDLGQAINGIGMLEIAPLAADAPAYVMLTSGSTGRPKGVVVTHGNLLASTRARFAYYDRPPEVFLSLSSFAFDSSVAGIYWTLAAGGTLLVAAPHIEQDVQALARRVREQAVTHTLCLPSLYDLLLEFASPADLASLVTVIVAGEAVPAGLPARHQAVLPKTSLVNEYGPTEATVWCAAAEITSCPADRAPPIGRPIPGAVIRLMVDGERRAPLGAIGELWAEGAGIAEGYLGQPGETARSFLPGPAAGTGSGRRYRTGDLGRYLKNGDIEFLGRRDRQVKIRGHRIETGEIEAVLRRHAEVADAWVGAASPRTMQDRNGDRQLLIAAVVPALADNSRAAPDQRPDPLPGRLLELLRERFPAWMTPSHIIVVEAFPRLPNGKVDEQRLAQQCLASVRPSSGSVEPRDGLERDLVEIWHEVLGGRKPGIDDDYFELGGDSLSSIRIVALARKRGHVLAPSELFEFPTIAELAAARRREQEAPGESDAQTHAHAPSGVAAPATLFMVHGGRRIREQLARCLAGERTVHLLADHRDTGAVAPFATIGSLADEYLRAIRTMQDAPPWLLGGYSVGAPIAVEMAQRLVAGGHEPPLLFLLDPPDDPSRFAKTVAFEPLAPAAARTPEDPRIRKPVYVGNRWTPRLLDVATGVVCRSLRLPVPLFARRRYVPWVYDRALRGYELKPYGGPMLIFHSSDAMRDREGRTLWQRLEGANAETMSFDARHTEFVRDPAVVEAWTRALAERLRDQS